jgi:hypothetical protein
MTRIMKTTGIILIVVNR